MNSKNSEINYKPENIWLCLKCEQKVIPFEKGSKAGLVEGFLFLSGIATLLFVSIFVGVIFVALAVIIKIVRSNGKKKVCPSCESLDIVSSMSPAAKRVSQSY